MKSLFIPSIIAKNQKEINERIEKVRKDFSLLQLDVMDGKFVENKSVNFNFKLPKTKCKYEAHLMVEEPEKWVEKNYRKVSAIIFHFEATRERTPEVIKLIKSKKLKVGIAINPRTSLNKIKPFLNQLDEVIIMAVNPGKYGSEFIPSVLKKVRQLRKLKPKLNIEVDGGVNDKTIHRVSKAGANMFILGLYVYKSKNLKNSMSVLKKQIS